MNVEKVFQGYVDCALWSSCDEEGNPLDSGFDILDIGNSSLDRMREVVVDFIAQCEHLEGFEDIEASQVGHDLWLTQNRHGAGFWDRGLGDLGRKLTDIAHSMGEAYLYVGDDDTLHFMG